MKRSLTLIILLSIFFFSCTNKPGEGSAQKRVAKGNRVYGGTLKVSECESYQTLYPPSITDAISYFFAEQIYEGLVKFNTKDLSIKPALAEKWDIDSSGTVYTFHLKKGAMFQDDPCFPDGKGREVKAGDVKYSFEMLCTDMPNNFNFSGTFKNRVLDANKYFEESKKGKPSFEIEGFKVIDDYTFRITLEAPDNTFINILAGPSTAVLAKEAVDKYGVNIKTGTGPFVFVETDQPEKKIILKRNENYHGIDSLGNQLPYLDSILVAIIPSKKEELEEFEKGNLDIVLDLYSESANKLVENNIDDFLSDPPRYIIDRTPEMRTDYYGFNLTRVPFNNVKVRKAFSYAINRNKIVTDVLKGEAYSLGINGIVPPVFKEYDIKKIKGYDFDPEKARKLLAEAGYSDSKKFPTVRLELNNGTGNIDVASEIQKQIRDVLGINIELEIVSFKQKLEDERLGKAEMFGSSWIADYPSPENFLSIVYGSAISEDLNAISYPNSSKYKNAEFDKLFETGRRARTTKEGYEYFAKAEQLMMDDAPLMILWYGENYRLYRSHIKNLFANAMRYKNYSEVYLQPVKKAEDINKKP